MRIAFLASGRGSNFSAVMQKIQEGACSGEPVLLLSNNSQSGALESARMYGLEAIHLSEKTAGSQAACANQMIDILKKNKIDCIVLAGYMKPVPLGVLDEWANRVINIHPALLPAFGGQGWYGHYIHEGVVKRGAQITGITIHTVTPDYDAGPILWQRALCVPPGTSAESLAQRVLKLEHDSLWRVIDALSKGILLPDSKAPEGIRGLAEFFESVKNLPIPN